MILKSFSCPQKMLCIVMNKMVYFEHWVMFVIQKSGGFLSTDQESV